MNDLAQHKILVEKRRGLKVGYYLSYAVFGVLIVLAAQGVLSWWWASGIGLVALVGIRLVRRWALTEIWIDDWMVGKFRQGRGIHLVSLSTLVKVEVSADKDRLTLVDSAQHFVNVPKKGCEAWGQSIVRGAERNKFVLDDGVLNWLGADTRAATKGQ